MNNNHRDNSMGTINNTGNGTVNYKSTVKTDQSNGGPIATNGGKITYNGQPKPEQQQSTNPSPQPITSKSNWTKIAAIVAILTLIVTIIVGWEPILTFLEKMAQ
jgi:hypothetical protein